MTASPATAAMDEAPGLARRATRRSLTAWLARLRLASQHAARPTACSEAHVWPPIGSALFGQRGVLANYGLRQTRADGVRLCAKHQVFSSRHRERNMRKPLAAEPWR